MAQAPAARPGADAPGPIERQRRVRRGRIVRALLVITLALLVGLALRGLASERLVRWAAEQAVRAAGGRLTIEQASGSLLGTVHLERVVWHDPKVTVAVRRVALNMGWYALLRGRLRAESLSAAHLEVLTEPSDAPHQLPASLHIPLAFELGAVQLDEAVLRQTGSDRPVRLRAMRGALRYDRHVWRVSGARVLSPWGELEADATLQDRAPFALTGQARGVWRPGDEAVPVQLQARGDLNDLHVDAQAPWRGTNWQLRARGVPWAAQPLANLSLAWTDLDTARWHPHAPATLLQGQLELVATPGPVPWTTQWPAWRGQIQTANAAAGRLSEGRVPVARVESTLNFDGHRLSFDAVRAVGPPGAVTGSAQVWAGAGHTRAPEFNMAWATQRLDLAQIFAGLRSTALQGQASLRSEASGWAIEGRLSEGPRAVTAGLLWSPGRLQLQHSRWSARQGAAELAGELATAAPHRFSAEARLAGWDPTEWLALPAAWGQGRLQGTVRARGNLGAAPTVEWTSQLLESRWRELPLRAVGQGQWQPDRLSGLTLALRWGGTDLRLQGALGRATDRLSVQLDVSRLSEFDRDWAGRWSGRAELSGPLHDPTVSWDGEGRAWAWGRMGQVQTLATHGVVRGLARVAAGGGASPERGGPALAADAEPDFDVQMQLTGVHWGEATVDRVESRVRGAALAHEWTLHAVADAPAADLRLRAQGAWREGGAGGWSGQVLEAVLGGAFPARLLEPARVALYRGGGLLMPVRLELDGADGAQWDLEQASWQDGALRVQGRLQRVPLRWLKYWPRAAFSGLRLDDADALRLGGRIDLSGSPGQAGGVQGFVEVFRESGDLRLDLPGAQGRVETVAAGLDTAVARLDVAAGVMRAVLNIQGSAIGTVNVQARAPWTTRAGAPWPAGEAPLRGQLALELPSLAFARALAGDAWRFDGAVSAQGVLAGTLAAPQLSGQVRGERLRAEQRELGMRLTDGVLRATLRENVLELETLRFASGRGSVSLTGALRPDERSQAVLVLDHLPIPLGAGQRLVVSGEARAALRGGELTLRGALRAEEGVLELSGRNAPRVSEDVVRVRDTAAAARHRALTEAARQAPDAGPVNAPREARGFRIVSDLRIDLGEALRVFGSGLEARLTGQLSLQGTVPDAPRLHGTLRIVEGTYTGFGQKLDIERGVLVFSGPVDNPAIDIVAYRRYLPVEAGVALTGTAQTPHVMLVSRPDVPEPDKLSWLVLGVGSDQSRSGGQNAALQAAAATLLASADPGMTGPGLAKSLGLDVVSIRTGQAGGSGEPGAATASAQDSIVMLGKRLSQRVFLSYEQSLRGLQNLVRLQYEITERLSIRGRAGTQKGLDLLWTYRYD